MTRRSSRIALAAALFLLALVLFWRALPNPDLASPEANLSALVEALQDNDQRRISRLSTAEGLETIEIYVRDGQTTHAKLGVEMADYVARGVTRHRTTKTEVVLVGEYRAWYFDFVPTRNGWSDGWKFEDMRRMVA